MTVFTPPKTLRKFMLDDSLARFVVGPLGSAKSTSMIMELMRRSIAQAPTPEGVRPTRWAIVRNTLQQLRQTCLADIREWLDPIIEWKVYESTVYLNVPLPDGTRIRSEWLLVPIDTEEDTRRLLSLQLTGAWASEFRELPYQVVSALLGRCGRYPRARVAPTWHGLIAESNPFSDGSEWHDHLEVDLPSQWRFFRQPGGLDPDAENRENLPRNYYENLVQGHDDEWVRVHVHAQNGDDLSGQVVFRRAFSDKLHVATDPIQVDRRRPLMVMQDLGRTPTAIIGQTNAWGGLHCLQEVVSTDMGLHQFCAEKLVPVLREDRFANCPVFVVADPSGEHKSQLREENAGDVFRSHGLTCYFASTNDIQQRLMAVEKLLTRVLGGRPAFLVDPWGCPLLLTAFKSKYIYRRRKTGEVEDSPHKSHPWSDLVDACQYGALALQLNLQGRYLTATQKVFVPPPPPTSAWT